MNKPLKKNIVDTVQTSEVDHSGELNFILPKINKNKTLKLLEDQIEERSELISEINSTIDQIQENIHLDESLESTNLSLGIREEIGPINSAFTYSKTKRYSDSAYYQIRNHFELHRTGQSFVNDYDNGLKSFAFNSLAAQGIQQDTILGIGAFFNYHKDIMVTILSDRSNFPYYFKRLSFAEKSKFRISALNVEFDVVRGHGLEIIDIESIRNIVKSGAKINQEDIFRSLKTSSDLLLYDLPLLETSLNDGMMLSMLQEVDKISLIVKAKGCRFTEVKSLVQYYQRYKVCLKGLIVGI